MTVIWKFIDGEVTPLAGGQERLQNDTIVCAWPQADKPGNKRVGKAGVVVVIAAAYLFILGYEHVLRDPLAGVGIKVFIDPIDDMPVLQRLVLRENVAREELVIIGESHHCRSRTILIGGEGEQRLRHCEGPLGTVPGALVGTGKAEPRATTLCSRRS